VSLGLEEQREKLKLLSHPMGISYTLSFWASSPGKRKKKASPARILFEEKKTSLSCPVGEGGGRPLNKELRSEEKRGRGALLWARRGEKPLLESCLSCRSLREGHAFIGLPSLLGRGDRHARRERIGGSNFKKPSHHKRSTKIPLLGGGKKKRLPRRRLKGS